MNLNLTKILLLGLTFIIAIAFFIHPTLYKYVENGQNGLTTLKINRITGNVQICTADRNQCWKPGE